MLTSLLYNTFEVFMVFIVFILKPKSRFKKKVQIFNTIYFFCDKKLRTNGRRRLTFYCNAPDNKVPYDVFIKYSDSASFTDRFEGAKRRKPSFPGIDTHKKRKPPVNLFLVVDKSCLIFLCTRHFTLILFSYK